MATYLIEIGTEELPPKAVNIAREFLKEKLNELFLNFFEFISEENIKEFSTPRRIAFLIKNLKEKIMLMRYLSLQISLSF